MPLILPILRAFWVFSNVFESFKTLRLPPPSSRNGGKPTVRAMSQRKRNMKGCMTVWLVWCCFTAYERTLDGVVGLFIPFYNEIKSLVILFFIVTRARGAEPIYLHILRPVVKPYVATLDMLLDVTHSLGDFLLLLASVPLDFITSIYRPSEAPSSHSHSQAQDDQGLYPPTTANERNTRRGNVVANGNASADGPTETVHGAVRARRRPLESAHARTTSNGQAAAAQSSSRSNPRAQPGVRTAGATAGAQHEVWLPSRATYEDEKDIGLPTPPREEPLSLAGHGEDVRNPAEDWRKYEAFPSAYPPTPLPSTSNLPADHNPRGGMTAISEEPHLDEPGDWRNYEAFPSAYPATPPNRLARLPASGYQPLQIPLHGVPEESANAGMSASPLEHDERDFQGSLERPREHINPGSADSSDDHENYPGVRRATGMATDDEDEMDVDESYGDDEEDEDEEDDFDVTLRTPARISRLDNISKASSTMTDASTGLSTTDNGSPFRTRTNSEASTLLNGSDSSSVAGQKRPMPFSAENPPTRTAVARRPAQAQGPKKTGAKGVLPPSNTRAVRRATAGRRQPSKKPESSANMEGTGSDASDGTDASALKRQRVGVPAATASREVRPGHAARSSSDRTIRPNGGEARVRASLETSTAPNTGTVRLRSRASQPSIASAKRLSTDTTASEAAVGGVPAPKTRRTGVPFRTSSQK